MRLTRPVVGITPTADEGGYWLVGSDGGVFAFGDAGFYGSIPGLGIAPTGTTRGPHLVAPVVGVVPSFDDKGYFMVGSDGGVFAFGDSHFEGSCPGLGGCSGPAVAVAPDADGGGYWLVTATGHIYTFGDARYLGAPGPQSSAITSMVRTPDGGGYWLLDADGQVFSYGDAANWAAPPPPGSTRPHPSSPRQTGTAIGLRWPQALSTPSATLLTRGACPGGPSTRPSSRVRAFEGATDRYRAQPAGNDRAIHRGSVVTGPRPVGNCRWDRPDVRSASGRTRCRGALGGRASLDSDAAAAVSAHRWLIQVIFGAGCSAGRVSCGSRRCEATGG